MANIGIGVERYWSFRGTYGREPDKIDLRFLRGETTIMEMDNDRKREYLDGGKLSGRDVIAQFFEECGLIVRKFKLTRDLQHVPTTMEPGALSGSFYIELDHQGFSVLIVETLTDNKRHTLSFDIDIRAVSLIKSGVALQAIDYENLDIAVPFPDNIYDKAPDVYRRVFDNWMDSTDSPIASFAFVTIDGAFQTLVGQKVQTPQKGRTVATYTICASKSTAGKDNSAILPLSELKRELIEFSTSNMSVISKAQKLSSGFASITNDTAFLGAAKDWDGNFLWISSEASEIMKIISSADNANMGGSLAVAINNSYDGKEILGKRKASQKIDSILFPNIPIVWLTQPEFINQTLTPELLHKGTLGRFDYVFDYSPPDRSESMIHSMPCAEDHPEEVKQFQAFSNTTLRAVNAAISSLPEGRILPTKEARNLFAELDDSLLVKRKYSSQKKRVFMCRTAMSVEKRLTAWVAMSGRNVITVKDVESIIPWFEYQVKMRSMVYDKEVSTNAVDSFSVVRRIINLARKYDANSLPSQSKRLSSSKRLGFERLRKSGIISTGDLGYFLRSGKYDEVAHLRKSATLQRELAALSSQGLLVYGVRYGFTGKFIWLPEM